MGFMDFVVVILLTKYIFNVECLFFELLLMLEMDQIKSQPGVAWGNVKIEDTSFIYFFDNNCQFFIELPFFIKVLYHKARDFLVASIWSFFKYII